MDTNIVCVFVSVETGSTGWLEKDFRIQLVYALIAIFI